MNNVFLTLFLYKMIKSDVINTIKINLNDVITYLHSSISNNVSHPITNLRILKSDIQTDGLKALNDVLVLPSKLSRVELQNKYGRGLLKDLEILSKSYDFQDKVKNTGQRLSFKKDFYEEIQKPLRMRSLEFNNFLDFCSLLNVPEGISAKMLIALGKPVSSPKTIANNLKEQLNIYKKQSQEQTTQDIGGIRTDINGHEVKVNPRAELLFKDKDGDTKIIQIEQIKNNPNLTGEQKDFITTVWHQGGFGTGWFTITTVTDNFFKTKGYPDMNRERDFLVVDISEPSKIILYNRANIGIFTDSGESLDYAQGVLKVDITKLKGTEFTPGCASNSPKIEVYISELNQKIRYDLPRELSVVYSHENDYIRTNILDDKKKAYVNEVMNKSLKTDKALNSLEKLIGISQDTLASFQEQGLLAGLKHVNLQHILTLPQDAKIASLSVECYARIEQDQTKLEAFAKLALEKYCDQDNVKVLNHQEVDRLQKGVMSIISPIIKDDQEKRYLTNTLGAIIRKCAIKEGIEMSLGQWLKAIILDTIRQFFENNRAKEIIKKHPEIKKVFQETSIKNTIPPSINQNRGLSSGRLH